MRVLYLITTGEYEDFRVHAVVEPPSSHTENDVLGDVHAFNLINHREKRVERLIPFLVGLGYRRIRFGGIFSDDYIGGDAFQVTDNGEMPWA